MFDVFEEKAIFSIKTFRDYDNSIAILRNSQAPFLSHSLASLDTLISISHEASEKSHVPNVSGAFRAYLYRCERVATGDTSRYGRALWFAVNANYHARLRTDPREAWSTPDFDVTLRKSDTARALLRSSRFKRLYKRRRWRRCLYLRKRHFNTSK